MAVTHRQWAMVALCAWAVFILLAIAVTAGGALVRLDQAVAAGLSLSMAPWLLWLLSWATHLGDRNFLIMIAALMTAGLLWRQAWRLAWLCAVVTAGGGLLNMLMKPLFQRVRPEHLHGYIQEHGWSFPSGHASGTMAVYGLAYCLAMFLLPVRWHRSCLAAAMVLIAAIGGSRVLLQVHYLSDVLAGFALSLAWLSTCLAVMGRWVRCQAR